MKPIGDGFRPLALVRDWHEFRKACRDRCDELQVAHTTVDRVGGLAAGHTSTLIAPLPPHGQGFGPMSLPAILGALGLALVVVEDIEAITRIRPKLRKRHEFQVRASASMLPLKRAKRQAKRKGSAWRKDTEWSRIMNARRVLILTPNKRKQIAKIAALTRWRKAQRRTGSINGSRSPQ